jgi:hypothetical protein
VTWRPPANCATIASTDVAFDADGCGAAPVAIQSCSSRRRSFRVPSVRGSSPDGHTEIPRIF